MTARAFHFGDWFRTAYAPNVPAMTTQARGLLLIARNDEPEPDLTPAGRAAHLSATLRAMGPVHSVPANIFPDLTMAGAAEARVMFGPDGLLTTAAAAVLQAREVD